jgi:hypothetical protein
VAKPRPIPGLDPDRRLARNARRILAVRIDEVWAFEADIVFPGRVRQLHDMRIALKRLRYLIEIFQIAFPADLTPYLDEVKALQDLLGDIHDRDVQVPLLHDHLERLAERDALAARTLVRSSGSHGRGRAGQREEAFAKFREQLDAMSTADERPGIEALLARRTRERDDLFQAFLTRWRELDDSRFRRRLEKALGI